MTTEEAQEDSQEQDSQEQEEKRAGSGRRQAIVVIHGMGEQKPGDTLRQMADAILPDREDAPRYISRPDKVTDGPDARRLLSLRDRQDDSSLQTEIYEYHWAHMMPGNTLSDLRPLLKWVLFSNPTTVPRILWAWTIGWLAVLAGGFVIGWVLAAGIVGELSLGTVLARLGVAGIVITIVGWLLKLVTGWVTSSFVDVARYLDAAPRNQEARDTIREGAVELLAGLHKMDRYSRVIIVAHSLGSFIAYDAINYLWARMNQADNTHRSKNVRLRAYEKWIEEQGEQNSEFETGTCRGMQRNLWEERRWSGNPWLITDFVSVGSPMAFSKTLLARGEADFQHRTKTTELPTNPPEPEQRPRPKNGAPLRYAVSYEKDQANVVYHGAPFAPVRWANIWFPSDGFSGPLAPTFGPGIWDIRAVPYGWQQHLPLVSHSLYFKRHDKADQHKEKDGSVQQLRDAVELTASWVPDRKDCPKPNYKIWPPPSDFIASLTRLLSMGDEYPITDVWPQREKLLEKRTITDVRWLSQYDDDSRSSLLAEDKAKAERLDDLLSSGDVYYVVVDEIEDDKVFATIDPWPFLDNYGRLAFVERKMPDGFDSQAPTFPFDADTFFSLVVACRENRDADPERAGRPLRIGDTFAMRVASLEAERSDWTVAEDVTAWARTAAKIAQSAGAQSALRDLALIAEFHLREQEDLDHRSYDSPDKGGQTAHPEV